MKKHIRLAFMLITVSGVFCTLFAVIWLQNRLSANDTPEMYAVQTAQRLRANPDAISMPLEPIDVSASLLPFMSVYDKSGKLVASSAVLEGKQVELPKGVVQHAQADKNHAVTWAPRKDVRLATVTVETDKYYVVSGQSLRAAENRIDRIMQWWLFGFFATLMVVIFGNYVVDRREMPRTAVPAAATTTAKKRSQVKRTGKKTPSQKK